MKKLLAILLLLACPWPALAQSNPGFTTGQIPTATQWNSYFTGKADYSEGSWTPVAAGSAIAGTLTYTTQVGGYIKVGNQVTAWANLIWTGTSGTQTGSAILTGLPFTASNDKLFFAGAAVQVNAPGTTVINAARISANTATVQLYTSTGATTVGATASDVFGSAPSATSSLSVTITYRIN